MAKHNGRLPEGLRSSLDFVAGFAILALDREEC